MLAHVGVVPVGQAADKIMGIGGFRRCNNLFQRCVRLGKANVIKDRSGKKEGFLQHHAHLIVVTGGIQFLDILAVHHNFSLIHIVQPHD